MGRGTQTEVARSRIVVTTVDVVAVFSVYVCQAQRVVYDASPRGASIRTLALALSIGPMLFAFKFVLFLATLYWIK